MAKKEGFVYFYNFFTRSHDRRTDPQTVTRLAGQRVAGDKGCGFYLPRKDDRRTNPQTVTRFAGKRVAGDKGCGFYLPRKDDRRTNPQTVTRFAGAVSRGKWDFELFFKSLFFG